MRPLPFLVGCTPLKANAQVMRICLWSWLLIRWCPAFAVLEEAEESCSTCGAPAPRPAWAGTPGAARARARVAPAQVDMRAAHPTSTLPAHECMRAACPALTPTPPAQEYMRAMQCFVYEWWDMDIKHMDKYFPEETLEGLLGGWCVELPEGTKICHLRANMGDWLADTLLPRLGALGAARGDIAVVNFAVWVNWAQARRRRAVATYYPNPIARRPSLCSPMHSSHRRAQQHDLGSSLACSSLLVVGLCWLSGQPGLRRRGRARAAIQGAHRLLRGVLPRAPARAALHHLARLLRAAL